MTIQELLGDRRQKRARKRLAKADPALIRAIEYLYQTMQPLGGWPAGFTALLARHDDGTLTKADQEVLAACPPCKTPPIELVRHFSALRPAPSPGKGAK